ncbi:Crp/Fnr family transcriptional regulator [Plantactinospora sp. S1510]|uniref:Crp/Fnr family transcriptional regulator n=1 Tax=Plantactinospora alkalitolerans TaxID=2789879 RepID=A0ABS0HAE4_9ACTN|nr:Crp/Fnr family transcriptional regulator [Plantactinospora alkalitolerans]MBF9135437.1 Crp/Fnr family transcriptional regulator [Plantactinospora alkalitolerans]
MTAATDLARLAAVPVFAELGPARLRRLLDRSVVRTAPAGAVLAVRGQPAAHVIVVEAGTLTGVHETADGRRLRLGEFRAPCAVDKSAVLDSGGYTATWVAATRVRYRLVPAGELLRLIDDVPAVRRHVLGHLAGRLRERQRDLVRTSFSDAGTRVAAWLVTAAARTGRRVPLPGAQQGLAESIGMTRVSVNRALRALTDEGLVQVEPGIVVVLAPELLAARAADGLS